MNCSRAVITGMSALCALGDTEQMAAGLRASVCGIGPLTICDPVFGTDTAAEIRGWNSSLHDRIGTLVEHLSKGAVNHSGIAQSNSRLAIVVALGRQFPISTNGSPRFTFWEPGQRVADALGSVGEVFTVYDACASGNDVIGIGLRLIRTGEYDAVLCCAADSQIAPQPIAEFRKLSVLSVRDPEGLPHPRPFDRRRNGFVLGEGGAAFVVEDAGHANRRGAVILAEVSGYGAACDAFTLTRGHPDCRGIIESMSRALKDAQITSASIDYINAHGTGTVVNDAAEAEAIRKVFGHTVRHLPVSSTKAATGHLLAGAAALELAICVLALRDQFVPATLNHVDADPDCGIDFVPGEARDARLTYAMSNAFGFGGHNASVILARC
ncbi:MAG TPA: beta-ketoacyl-[acyl-carrier-protein] synthase family protein [Gemmatimonadaceae bacterium]|nr:beta-ketoacyl-[acyl-carrier-protein] synthase family protein [Gemmatimonadaceae bacterium]